MPVDPALRRRQLFGLLIVAILLLLAGMSRSSWPVLFPPGWWRVW